ncbi:MAG: hypothetical protein PHW77_07080 [Eubacteriales bacterium]|nr:hypothetical protein [Eubacteriales bacterium]
MKRLRGIVSKGRKAMAIETAIYTMVVVFIMISTIMYVTVHTVDDDIRNNEAALERLISVDRIGEDFVAHILYGEPFLTEIYTNYNVIVSENTLIVKEENEDKVLLTVTVTDGQITCWTH